MNPMYSASINGSLGEIINEFQDHNVKNKNKNKTKHSNSWKKTKTSK